jgi:ectoine hydroxylase-related dioxygenase (phytanoyl-CoA dioxygenase family)
MQVRKADYCAEAGNCVVVLDDMATGNGCLHYLRASHRRGLRRHGAGVVSFSQAIPELTAAERREAVPVVARRGDVIAHHCLTVHWADVNASRRARCEAGQPARGRSCHSVMSCVTCCHRSGSPVLRYGAQRECGV